MCNSKMKWAASVVIIRRNQSINLQIFPFTVLAASYAEALGIAELSGRKISDGLEFMVEVHKTGDMIPISNPDNIIVK